MYHPTSRVLTVLELLQSRPGITGPELAARLEMDVRTVRRYINHLQDVGIPVESTIGRYGGYRLRPSFKLPPMMFSEEEAAAVVLGLLASTWLEVGQSPVAVEGALAKITRVLPRTARERLEAVSSHLILLPTNQQARPDASLLINLSEAIALQQRITLSYRSYRDEVTERKVEPYGVVGRSGHWYLVAYCCLRQDYRTFRLDRIQHLEQLTEPFDRVEDFDCQRYMQEHYTSAPNTFSIKVEFHAPIYTLQQKIPATYGELSATETGTLFQSQYEDINGMARYLISLNIPFTIHEPDELRDALKRFADQIMQLATNHLPTTTTPQTVQHSAPDAHRTLSIPADAPL